MGRSGHRFFAWGYAKMARRQDASGTAEHRRRMLSRATGRVVEVGAGTGLNLSYYPPAVIEVIATEPDPHMVHRLVAAVGSATVPVRVVRAEAEAIPVADRSADTVVMSLVLCSVEDLSGSLAEALRVLRPRGRLLFFEHVRADGERLARWQDRLQRPWGLIAGGCHPNRDTVAAIRTAGFDVLELDRFDERNAWLAKPHVLGWAERP